MLDAELFPRVAEAVSDGIRRQLHTGIQIYVSRNSVPLLNTGIGQAAPEHAMTSDTVMPWRSAAKPVTAALVWRCIERSEFQLETALVDLLPEAVGTDKAEVTILDLLTHQSGFPLTDTQWPHADWETSVQLALETPRTLPRRTAAYHPQSSWFLLGEIVRRRASQAAGRNMTFGEVLHHQLLQPLQMNETWCGLPDEQVSKMAPRLPVLYDRDRGQLVASRYSEIPWLTAPSPGGNLRGPVRQLGLFFEMLLRNGSAPDGTSFLNPLTIHRMLQRHRAGEFDQTLQHIVDFGAGIIMDSSHHGVDTVPYGFGRLCSPQSFGHGGSQCSIAFCDPQHALVVVWAANGFCGEGMHQRRNRMLNEAIYQDLGLG